MSWTPDQERMWDRFGDGPIEQTSGQTVDQAFHFAVTDFAMIGELDGVPAPPREETEQRLRKQPIVAA